MKDLAALFDTAGCSNVRTYIQSGNVVFSASPAVVKRVPALIAAAISRKFGFDSPVIVRSTSEMRAIATHNPFVGVEPNPALMHVVFLADAPTKTAVASLDPKRSPPDRFVVRGRDIYLHVPNGAGRSKLTAAYFDSTLKTISSARNWNTVLALLEMLGE